VRLAVITFFRNATGGQIQRFMQRLVALRDLWPFPIRLIAVHGDSTDGTPLSLERYARHIDMSTTLIEKNHGGPVYGSIESKARFRALSLIGNAALDAVDDRDDLVWYVESDLKWEPETVLALAEQLRPGEVDVVAPLVFAGSYFYDVFSYRGLDGSRFGSFPPYHASLNGAMNEVGSIGSAFVMRACVARDCGMGKDGVLVGFCEDARKKGYHVFVNTALRVEHPL
jgi:hypothetical protein